MAPTAKSLILDLLSTLGRGSAPVRSLIEAASLFEIAGNNVRVTLARLLADGLVERDERGSYRLGPEAGAVHARIRSWRRLEEEYRPWEGCWVAVHLSGADARTRLRRQRALHLLGFRPLEPGLELRPDNLRGGVEAVRRDLVALGLDAAAPVFRVDALDPATEARARRLWKADALVQGYRSTVARLAASARRLESLPRGEAMVESFTLGGDAIRQLVLDPLLPGSIVPERERRALVEATRRYDRLGRRMWAGWLGAGAPPMQASPAGVRGLEAAGRILRATGGAR